MTTLPLRLWAGQIGAVLRLELKKALFSRRAWWIYLLAAAPAALCGAHSIVLLRQRAWHGVADDTIAFAAIYHIFFLRLGIFFGCVGIFMNLFRREVLEKTLHYYLLAPIRREWIVVGKYLAGLIADVAAKHGRDMDSSAAGRGLAAMMEGAWVHCIIDVEGVTVLEAQRLCLDYASRLLGLELPRG